jgi:hypothetical protein
MAANSRMFSVIASAAGIVAPVDYNPADANEHAQ